MKLVRLLSLLSFVLTSFSAFSLDPNVSVYIQNGTYLAGNIYQFDVMMKATGATSSFQLRTFQAGLYVSPAWLNGGQLTIINAPTFTDMAGSGYNGVFQWNPTDKLINCSVNFDVVSANGCVATTVTTTPILITRIQVTNTVNFTCVSPDIKFNYVANASPYRLRTDFSWRAVGCTTNYDVFYPGRTFNGSVTYNGEVYSANDADGKSPVSTFNGAGYCMGQLKVTVLLEGFYTGTGHLAPALYNSSVTHANDQQSDTVLIELRSQGNPAGNPVASFKTILYADGNAYCLYPLNSPFIGTNCYIVVKHRNAVETWSKLPVAILSDMSYDFTSAKNKAYGDNQIQAFDNNQLWTIFSGDISDAGSGLVGSQDGVIESQDYLDMENAVAIIKMGYVYEDITGDGVVEASDYFFMENNVNRVVFSLHP